MLERARGGRILIGRLPERTNGAASKAVVASGSPWVRIPHLPPGRFALFAYDLVYLRALKKFERSSPHSTARMPLVTSA